MKAKKKKKNICVQSVENILPGSGVLADESCANTDNWLCMTNMENNTCNAIQGNQMEPVFKSVLARGSGKVSMLRFGQFLYFHSIWGFLSLLYK